MKRVAMVVIGVLVASMFGVLSAAPASAVDYVNTGKNCNWQTYKSHYKVKVKKQKPILTHVQNRSIPPMGTRSVTRRTRHSTTLRAKVRYNSSAEITTKGLGKVIGQASAKVGFGLAASGKRTVTKSKKVTATISNPTKKNKAFVFFAGQTLVKGTFRYYYCEQAGSRSAPWTVLYIPGKWKSYGVYGDGALRCGAGSQTGLQKLALKIGCV